MKMPVDARDCIADAILQGRFRYAARILFQWREHMTVKDEHLIRDDIESFGSYPVEWAWFNYNMSVTLRYKGEVFSYRRQDVIDEVW